MRRTRERRPAQEPGGAMADREVAAAILPHSPHKTVRAENGVAWCETCQRSHSGANAEAWAVIHSLTYGHHVSVIHSATYGPVPS